MSFGDKPFGIEAFAALVGGTIYDESISESASASDSLSALAVFGGALSESVSASDSVGAALVLAAAISEAVSAADGWTGAVGAQVFDVELAEAVSAGDVFEALGVLARHGVRGAKGVQQQMRTRSNIQTARRYN